jgi:hypothetical protein
VAGKEDGGERKDEEEVVSGGLGDGGEVEGYGVGFGGGYDVGVGFFDYEVVLAGG